MNKPLACVDLFLKARISSSIPTSGKVGRRHAIGFAMASLAVLLAGCGVTSSTASIFETPMSPVLPPPAITSASPVTVPLEGGSGARITIRGTGFRPPLTVSIGEVSVTTAEVNRLQNQITLDPPAFTNSGSKTVTVTTGLGTATLPNSISVTGGSARFAPEQKFAVGTAPRGVEVGDMNGDGIPDIVTQNQSGKNISILRGVGDGTFFPAINLNTGLGESELDGLALGDLSTPPSDPPVLDIVVVGTTANVTDDNVVTYLNLTPTGGLFSFTPFVATATGIPLAIEVADFDKDGSNDLLFSAEGDDTTNATFTFVPASTGLPVVVFNQGIEPVSITSADIDEDTNLDLVAVDRNRAEILIRFGDGAGGFTSGPVLAGNAPGTVAVADLDGDGNLDIAAGSSSNGNIQVFYSDGSTFSTVVTTGTAGTEEIQILDIDDDGILDLLGSGASGVTIKQGQTGRTFATGVLVLMAGSAGLAVADLNADGKPDLVTTLTGSNEVSVRLNQTRFQPPGLAPIVRHRVGAGPLSVAVGDLDADGWSDLAIVRQGMPAVSLFHGLGGGTFGGPRLVPAAGYPQSVGIRDMDGDGVSDLALAYSSRETAVLSGHGNGRFRVALRWYVPVPSRGEVLADLDGDGVLDRVETLTDGDAIEVTIREHQDRYPVGRGPIAVAVGDVDGDRRPDIVTANVISGTVSVLRGLPGGRLWAARDFAVGRSPNAVAIGDVDGDGRGDVVVSDFESGEVIILSRPR